MKKIKVKFVDYWPNHHLKDDIIYQWLSKNFELDMISEPDYIIYSCFGYEHLNFDCVRIFYTAENVAPNLNECDYALSFEKIKCGDRCIELPNFFKYKKEIEMLYESKQDEDEKELTNREFCSYVVSNGCGDSIREKIFDELSKYKTVASGGKFKNNVGGSVEDKLEFQRNYKFAIAFENSSHVGYTTEKILQAFASRTVPIYWGDPQVSDYFNPRAFINVMDFESLDEVIDFIKLLDNDDERYIQYLRQSPWKEANLYKTKMDEFNAFMTNIFEQEPKAALRRNISAMVRQNEKNIIAWKENYDTVSIANESTSFLRRVFRFIRRLI